LPGSVQSNVVFVPSPAAAFEWPWQDLSRSVVLGRGAVGAVQCAVRVKTHVALCLTTLVKHMRGVAF
jgi:hypothetical protein